MQLRSRPDGTVAAARVAQLLDSSSGGWVPAPDEEVVPLEEPPLERSWDPRSEVVVAGRRLRLEPGRRAAAALCVVVALAAVIASAVVLRGRPQEVAAPLVEAGGLPLPGVSADTDPAGAVLVAVAGKVRKPGVVRLPAGSRVDDAVRAAGGPLDAGDLGLLNLARKLVDGEQVLVGVDPAPGAPAAAGGGAVGGLIDLNTATAADLDALPGIGMVLAQRIIDWRTENGRFESVDQLREVTGIGEAKYEDLRDKVVVP